MQSANLKQYSNVLFMLAFGCAVLMFSSNTFGYRTEIQLVFFISGALALILSLVASRQEINRDDFNILFWLGSLVVFIGLLLKTYSLPFWEYVLFPGMGITGLSYFINPFSGQKDSEQEDELLDQ